MSSEFDFLINSEVIVNDVGVAERVFVEALGFPQPKPTWSRKEQGYGFTFLFARVHPSLAVSPTRIEAMATATIDPAEDPERVITFLPNILAAQGDRPWKTHANELASSDIDAVQQKLIDRGCPVHVMPRTERTPFARLWLGWDDEPSTYRPEADGGLFLEVCETAGITTRAEFWQPTSEPELPPGSMLRVVQRSWIVPDLGTTLAHVAKNLDWHPDGEQRRVEELGAQAATFRFRHPRSADLQLLEPVAPGELKDSLDAWGPGAWAIRIAVNDVAAKADDLRRRGTSFEERTVDGGRVLRVDTGALGVPGLFDFTAP